MCNYATNEAPLTIRIVYAIEGTVQGVGFRPTIFRLAKSANIGGWIQNRSGTVHLCLEGTPEEIGEFIIVLHSQLPSQASIEHIKQLKKEKIDITEKSEFKIIESETSETKDVIIPADLAMCKDCEKEIMNCEDRRFGYPFTTCTNCGPRYTVVNYLPYDRERTTLSKFPLCKECQKEYDNPDDRRFHAESIACPKCGPKLSLVVEGKDFEENSKQLLAVRAKLADGEIGAIRGIGGYLLAADAFNEKAIKILRQRKKRPSKPFAVMFRDVETVLKYCKFNAEAVKLLMSPQTPIVILDIDIQDTKSPSLPSRSPITDHRLPITKLSPDSNTIGAMIPYSPLHKLLFEPINKDTTPPFEALVMTSGNLGGEPICITNEEALERLDGIADFVLTHNREINLRNDDSLCIIQLGKPQVWRRARGYAPSPVKIRIGEEENRGNGESERGRKGEKEIRISNIQQGISNNEVRNKEEQTSTDDLLITDYRLPITKKIDTPVVLAMGAELKNTIAMGYGDEIVQSPHIGDLEAPEAVTGMEQVVECFPKFLGKKPELIVVDLHPDMQSTRLGKKLVKELFPESGEADKRTLSVQHHYAHAASCMGEHGLSKALALVFDGTGLGTDGNIWGAECFAVDFEKMMTEPDRNQYRTLTLSTGSEVLAPTPIRLATFAPVPLPGGDAAVFHPVRQLVARYHNAGLSCDEICDKMQKYQSCSDKEIALWITQCKKGLNAPLSHAAGRLFDTVSIMLGIAPENISYEGQSAIALESTAQLAKTSLSTTNKYDLKFIEKEENDMLVIDWKNIFKTSGAGPGLCTELAKSKYGTDPEVFEYAFAFHQAVAKSAVRMIEYANSKYPMKNVVLSGGVFMNRILTELASTNLTNLGFNVYIHRKVPPNDGGIAFGQALIGMCEYNSSRRNAGLNI
jgi:hydrogenase maturation protein HypF